MQTFFIAIQTLCDVAIVAILILDRVRPVNLKLFVSKDKEPEE